MTPGGEKLIRFENVTKEFSSKNNKTLAVNNVNLEIEKGVCYTENAGRPRSGGTPAAQCAAGAAGGRAA